MRVRDYIGKKIIVYYHIWSPPDTDIWKIVVDEQIKRLYSSGIPEIATIKCSIHGVQASRIKHFVSLYDWIDIIECIDSDSNGLSEGITLKYLYQDCINEHADNVMFFHNKGMSTYCGNRIEYSDRYIRAVNSWRHLMEWGCIDKWKESLDKLDTYQVTGVLRCLHPWIHLSGNFWWARADYITTLPDPTKLEHDKLFGLIERVKFERWVGRKEPTIFSFYDPPFDYETDEGFIGMKPDIQPTPEGEPPWFWLYRDDIHPYYLKG